MVNDMQIELASVLKIIGFIVVLYIGGILRFFVFKGHTMKETLVFTTLAGSAALIISLFKNENIGILVLGGIVIIGVLVFDVWKNKRENED